MGRGVLPAYPKINILLRKSSTHAHFKSRDLLDSHQPVNGSFGDLRVFGHFPNSHDLFGLDAHTHINTIIF